MTIILSFQFNKEFTGLVISTLMYKNMVQKHRDSGAGGTGPDLPNNFPVIDWSERRRIRNVE